MSKDFSKPDLVRQMILDRLKVPVVFQGFINDWEILSWSFDTWIEKFGDKILPFRSGNKEATKVDLFIHLTLKS